MFFRREIIAKWETEQQGMKQIAQFEEKQVVKRDSVSIMSGSE